MERINFGRVGAWRVANPGEPIKMPGGKRDIVIAFATSMPTPLMLIQEGQPPLPLGVVNGIVEYTIKVMGPVEIFPDNEDVIAYRTQDGDGVSYQTDAVPFVGMMERRVRNLGEERIAFIAMQNSQRRQRQMEESMVGMAAMVEALKLEQERLAAAGGAPPETPPNNGGTPPSVAE